MSITCQGIAYRPKPLTAWLCELPRNMPKGSKPLRVTRVLELGMPFSSAGRLLMSGNIADICAELDRLAAQEMTQ